MTSAIYACAVEIVAPAIPAPMRVMKSQVNGVRPASRAVGERDDANPKTAYEAVEPARPRIRIGRRPTRSETCPQIGEKTNCIAENDAINSPRTGPSA